MHTEPRNGASIDRIYLHKNEGPERVNGAQELGHYLATIDAGYHAGVDNQQVYRYASDDQIVWAEGGDNLHALSIVLVGWSSATAADYATDPYLNAQFKLAAKQVAQWCSQYDIPVTAVAPGTPLHAPTERGIAEHAWDHDPRSEGHTDPGDGFPIDAFIKLVKQINTTPQGLATMAIWKQLVTDHPLEAGEMSWAVTALKQFLNHIHEGPNNTSPFYGPKLVACVKAFKVKHKVGNADGNTFGGTAADVLFKLLGMTPAQSEQLQLLGQADLGAWVMAARGVELWTKQREIATALSVPRSKIIVPSTNASGKTFLAANLVIAFYDAFTPGAPCIQCDPDGTKGGCRGSKILTTSSKEIHLKDNLWGEIRMALADLARQGVKIPGTLAEADTLLVEEWGNHFIRGQVATKEEGFQGYHAAHKLILGDEATSIGQDVARGITSLMATADTRLCLIFNPTTNDTYAATMSRSDRVKVIRITAFDTPHFTNEHVPEGSNLTTPAFLDDLIAQGMGPGSYEWTTRIEAKFWDQGEDTLIPPGWIHAAKNRDPLVLGTVGMGIDLAPYGTAESAIGVRRGDNFVDLKAYPAERVDWFINGDPESDELSPVRRMVRDYGPYVIVYDADGPGAGATGEFQRLHDWAKKHHFMDHNSMIIPFRGGRKQDDHYTNARSGWWWALRRRFERGMIAMQASDPKLEAQLTQLTYQHTNTGQIRVETKQEMRNRSLESPDRGDAMMYTFSFSEELPDPDLTPASQFVVREGYARDNSEEAMWARDIKRLNQPKQGVNPVTGLPDEL